MACLWFDYGHVAMNDGNLVPEAATIVNSYLVPAVKADVGAALIHTSSPGSRVASSPAAGVIVVATLFARISFIVVVPVPVFLILRSM